jgi:hypothetical protein
MKADQFHSPHPSDGKRLVTFDCTPIRYRNVISVLKNSFYAGTYAHGKSEKVTEFVDGRPAKATATENRHEGYASTGRSSNGTRSSSRPTPMAKWGGEVGSGWKVDAVRHAPIPINPPSLIGISESIQWIIQQAAFAKPHPVLICTRSVQCFDRESSPLKPGYDPWR